MHPNCATSILFSNFLLIPTELTDSIKADGHQTLNVNLHRKDVRQDGATHSRSIEIPVGKMSDPIDHVENGKRSADYYVALYNEHCGDFGDVGSVLDFGCGCGPVLSRMPASDAIQYYGIELGRPVHDPASETSNQTSLEPGRRILLSKTSVLGRHFSRLLRGYVSNP